MDKQPASKEWTKHDEKTLLRKITRYVKYVNCDRNASLQPEADG